MAEKRNIPYIEQEHLEFHDVRHLLDVFYPEEKTSEPKPVVLFIHGGTWINGSKEIYKPLGRNLAEKGLVGVIINYRLGVDFRKMAEDCASAAKWVYNNIGEYGGDKDNITLCGHSAGGHLAALISLDKSYFEGFLSPTPVQRTILIDAFGLNIDWFIEEHGTMYLQHIQKIFTREPALWKKASPVNFVKEARVPFHIFVGSDTYPFLALDNEKFLEELKKHNKEAGYEILKGKSHVEMITQLDNKSNPLYEKIIEFIRGEKIRV